MAIEGLSGVGLADDESVIVSAEGGRFHRPGALGFPTACKIKFGRNTSELRLEEAVEAGYSPCKRIDCFG